MTHYLYRIQAMVHVLGLTALAVSHIGEYGKCEPMTWDKAWFAGLFMSYFVWLGWLARGEHDAAASGEAK